MAFHGTAFAIFNFDLFLCRDNHIKDPVFHAHGLNTLLEIVAHLVFVA